MSYSTLQYSTLQYNHVFYCIVQLNTTHHNTMQFIWELVGQQHAGE